MPVPRVVGLLILLCAFQSSRTFGQVVATWTDSSGNWSNAANWSTNPTVPNNGGGTTYNVVINGTGADTVTYDASGTVLNSLTLGAGEILQGSGAAPILTISPISGSTLNGIALGGDGTINGVNVMLSGGGEVELSSFVNSSLTAVGSVGMDRSISFNNSVLSVQGDLGTGGGGLALQNGTSATVSGTLSLSTGQITVSNSSLTVMGDYKGGNIHSALTLNSGVLNVQGNFRDAVSSLNLSGGSSATIGGNLTNAESNVMVNGSSLVVKGTYAIDNGQTTVQNGGSLRVAGDFQLDEFASFSLTGGSTITVGGNFNAVVVPSGGTISGSTMTVNGAFTNSAGGSVTLQNGGVLNVGGTFTNGTSYAPNSLQLAGQGNVANLYAVQNSGLVQVDTGSILSVGGGGFSNNTGGTLTLGGTTNVSGAFTNSGGSVILSPTASLTANSYSQSAGLTDVSGTLKTNSYSQTGGTTTIETGGTVTARTFTATGGTVTVNGILDPTAVEIGSGAALQGTGTIIGNVAMGGTIVAGAPGTPGTLSIIGNYEQIGYGTFDEQIGAPSAGFLNISGDAALDFNSLLIITLLNGYDPLGQTFGIMDYSSLVGQFSNGSSFWQDGFLWDISYGQHEIDVTAVSAPEPSSLLLLFLGLAALAFCAHKKMRTARHLA
jgi:fibronectin-binding autotransporter adhesin